MPMVLLNIGKHLHDIRLVTFQDLHEIAIFVEQHSRYPAARIADASLTQQTDEVIASHRRDRGAYVNQME